jgi:hypothetical protein
MAWQYKLIQLVLHSHRSWMIILVVLYFLTLFLRLTFCLPILDNFLRRRLTPHFLFLFPLEICFLFFEVFRFGRRCWKFVWIVVRRGRIRLAEILRKDLCFWDLGRCLRLECMVVELFWNCRLGRLLCRMDLIRLRVLFFCAFFIGIFLSFGCFRFVPKLFILVLWFLNSF